MGKDPAFLFYSADFLVGVEGLSKKERGEYITLLSYQHQHGHLTKKMFFSIKPSKAVVDKFFVDDEGKYYNRRLEEEIKKRANFVKKQRENGKKGGRPRKTQEKPTGFVWVNPNESHYENENDNSFNLVKDSTKVLSSNEDKGSTTFSFSKNNDNNNIYSTTTTYKYVYREGENEDGLLAEELEEIGDFLSAYFEDMPAKKAFDIQNDFVAYNKSKGWRGIGGEDVRKNLARYLRRWIENEYSKTLKRS